MSDALIAQIRSTLTDAMKAVDGLEAARAEVATPKIELPTDIGTVLWVQATDTRHWIVLTSDGWTKLHWGELFNVETLQEVLDVIAVPAPVTAKKVLDHAANIINLHKSACIRYGCDIAEDFDKLAREFGVTND